jgi:MFS family permease
MLVGQRRWLVLVTLFVTLFTVLGATANVIPVFLTPLMKLYGWSHARISAFPTIFSLMLGLAAPLVGWLLDRIDARIVMPAGTVLVVIGLVCASYSHTFWPMFIAFVFLGGGACAAAVVPGSMVAANWFSDRRGLAIGVSIAGMGVSGVVMPLVATDLIARLGVSGTFLALAAPLVIIVLPLLLAVIRTRPQGADSVSVAEDLKALPGLEVGPALRTPTFWLISFVQAFASAGIIATFYHMINFLIGAGYSPRAAALVLGTQAAVVVPGFILLGALADKFTARRIYPFALGFLAIGNLFLLGAATPQYRFYLAGFILLFGFNGGTTTSLTPTLLVESLGLRRFGTLWGLVGLASTVGLALGPMVIGRIYDVTGSYTIGFELSSLMIFICGLVALAISPAEGIETASSPAIRAVGH